MVRFAMTTFPSLVCLILLAVFAPQSQANEWNEKTFITFNEPVEIPGQVLSPGTYVFKLLDSLSSRDIVQILNQDETHVYATLLAVPDYRFTPTGKTVITFEERAQASPEAIQAWFFPGDNYGQEFVYPTAQAAALAKANHRPVLSTRPEALSAAARTVQPGSNPDAATLKAAPLKAMTPNGEEVDAGQVVQHQPR